jgi:hypothetical protein
MSIWNLDVPTGANAATVLSRRKEVIAANIVASGLC